MQEKITYELGIHHEKEVLFIRFNYNRELNERVRNLIGVHWSCTHKVWYVLNTPYYRQKFSIAPPLAGKAVLAHIHAVNLPAFQRFIETLKVYSSSTINTYRNEFLQLLYILKSNQVDELNATRLRSYFLYCINTLKLSENTLHSRINAIKFYFEQVLHQEKFFFEIPRPKKPSILPKVISPRKAGSKGMPSQACRTTSDGKHLIHIICLVFYFALTRKLVCGPKP